MPATPPTSVRFEPVRDARGPRLALVFGNQAPDGVCPWARADRCHHCDIGFGEGGATTSDENRARLRWFEEHYAAAWPSLAHLVLYNSGSTLNPVELDPAVLAEVVTWARETLPRLCQVSLDSRETFVTRARVEAVASALGPGRRLAVILGVESADDAIRCGHLEKRMPRRAIERAVAELAAARAAGASVGLSVNVVIGAPGTTAETAPEDAAATARYAVELADAGDLPLDLNLHPYYPSERGRARFPGHERAGPATVLAALRAIEAAAGGRATLFCGWQDEGHDTEPEVRTRELAELLAAMERVNAAG